MSSKRLLALADRFASGESVDWNAEANSTPDEQERAVVSAMGVLFRISEMHALGRGPHLNRLTRKTARKSRKRPTEHPSRWGHLERLDPIGKGSFGVVYKAWDRDLERWVALKLARFNDDALAEARLIAQVKHPNVVVVHGAATHDGQPGIWMEYIPGRNLDEIVKFQGPWDESPTLSTGLKLARALAKAHHAGVIHKDIKAQNVMRGEGGRIVLTDFGAGLKLEDSREVVEDDGVRATPQYLAPEVLFGEAPSVQSDIYSLGVLLFYLLTSEFPIQAKTRADLERAHREGRMRSLVDIRSDLSGDCYDVVEKALAPDKTRRFKSAGSMVRALERATRGKPQHSKWPKRVAALTLSAAFVGLIAWRVFVAFMTYSVEVSLLRANGPNTQELRWGSRVAPGDKLFASLESSRSLYTYVLNEDEKGVVSILFPIPGLELSNPLAADQTHHLPGTHNSSQVFWTITSAGIRERFLLVASRRPLHELENLLKDIPPARFGHPIEVGSEDLMKIKEKLRGIMGLAQEDSLTSARTRIFENVERMTDERARHRGVWVRRIELDNPD